MNPTASRKALLVTQKVSLFRSNHHHCLLSIFPAKWDRVRSMAPRKLRKSSMIGYPLGINPLIISINLLAENYRQERACHSLKRPNGIHHILLDLDKCLEQREKMINLRNQIRLRGTNTAKSSTQ